MPAMFADTSPPPLESPTPPNNSHALVTVLTGLVMLLMGIIVGYLSHPALVGYISPSATPVPTGTTAPTPKPTVDTARATQAAELMDYIVANTRHFRGNVNAPVTLIEFSDFQ